MNDLLAEAKNFRAMVHGECPSICEDDHNSDRFDDAISETEDRQAKCKHGYYLTWDHEWHQYPADFCPDCGKQLQEVKP